MFIRDRINRIITIGGYITIDNFMKEALSNNAQSYYKTTKFIGREGDFITAPEISQLFGEILGLWVVEKYLIFKKYSTKIRILELGPGSGNLMFNILKTLKLVPGLISSIELYFLEINKFFIKSQQQILKNYKIKKFWIKNINDIPKDHPIIVIANEFFDSLPIKQYIKKNNFWKERIITLDPLLNRLKFDNIKIDDSLEQSLQKEYPTAKENAIIEESKESLLLIQTLIEIFKKSSGSMLLVDYGYDLPVRNSHQFNSTLQAMFKNRFANLLENLGQYDITSHVNFTDIKKTLLTNDVDNMLILSQRDFLIKYGILIRLQHLKLRNTHLSHVLDSQIDILISKAHMGELFKILEFQKFKLENINQ